MLAVVSLMVMSDCTITDRTVHDRKCISRVFSPCLYGYAYIGGFRKQWGLEAGGPDKKEIRLSKPF